MKALQQVAIKDAGDQQAKFWNVETLFPMVLGVVRVRTKRVARIVQATLALHNFIIKSGGGYIEVPENVLEQDMG